MSVRITPAPVSSQVVAVPEFRSRSPLGDTSNAATGRTTVSATNAPAPAPNEPQVFVTPDMPDVLPPLPVPPGPPGATFATAVLAGALSPRPATAMEAFLRLGSTWAPSDSNLRLRDSTA